MANDTTLNAGSGGDTLRTQEKNSKKTPVSLLDVGGLTAESIIGESGVAMPVKGIGTAGTANAGVQTIQGIASMTPVQIGDNSGSITVDAPVATPVFVRLSDGTDPLTTLPVSLASVPSHAVTGPLTDTELRATAVPVSGTFWQATQPVSLASVPSHAVTNAGTFAVQVDGTGLTRLTDIETNTDSLAVVGGGLEATALRVTIASDSTGVISIDDGGNVITVDGTVAISGTVTVGSHAVTNAGTFVVQVDGAALTALQSIDGKMTACNTGAVVISSGTITAVTSITNALPAGTNAIGKLASNTGVTIGAVEIASAQTLATVTTVTTCATVSALNGSNLAHDSPDSGNPHKIGAKASVSLNGGTNVAGGDRTDLRASVDGALYVRGIPLEDIVTATPVAITDGSSTSVIAAQGASVKIYITEVIIANSSASNVTVDLRDGTAGSVKATFPVPAGGGVVKTLHTPLGFSANTAVAADPSAAASTITVTLIGFVSKI